MKQYELVCVIDASLWMTAVDDLKSSLVWLIPELIATDDMWLLPTAYPMWWQMQAWYVSYHIKASWDDIVLIKKELRLLKGLLKSVFYTLKSSEDFILFSDLKKSFETLVEKEEKLKQKKEKVQEDVVQEDLLEVSENDSEN